MLPPNDPGDRQNNPTSSTSSSSSLQQSTQQLSIQQDQEHSGLLPQQQLQYQTPLLFSSSIPQHQQQPGQNVHQFALQQQQQQNLYMHPAFAFQQQPHPQPQQQLHQIQQMQMDPRMQMGNVVYVGPYQQPLGLNQIFVSGYPAFAPGVGQSVQVLNRSFDQTYSFASMPQTNVTGSTSSLERNNVPMHAFWNPPTQQGQSQTHHNHFPDRKGAMNSLTNKGTAAPVHVEGSEQASSTGEEEGIEKPKKKRRNSGNEKNEIKRRRSSSASGRAPPSSKYRGVSWHKRDKAWVARVWVDGKTEHVGVYSSEVRAAVCVDRRLLFYKGDAANALLNFPDPETRERLLASIDKGIDPKIELDKILNEKETTTLSQQPTEHIQATTTTSFVQEADASSQVKKNDSNDGPRVEKDGKDGNSQMQKDESGNSQKNEKGDSQKNEKGDSQKNEKGDSQKNESESGSAVESRESEKEGENPRPKVTQDEKLEESNEEKS